MITEDLILYKYLYEFLYGFEFLLTNVLRIPFKIPLHWKHPCFATIQNQISLLLHFCVLAIILRVQNVAFPLL